MAIPLLISTASWSLMNFMDRMFLSWHSEEEFAAEYIDLKEGALVYINYAEWTDANPEGIYFGVDLDGDGEIDDEYVVDDTTE